MQPGDVHAHTLYTPRAHPRTRDTNLLESVLQDVEGLGQVPRLSPSPRREERAARGQSQREQRQRSPEHAQPAHPPPLQNPLHVGADQRVLLSGGARAQAPLQLHIPPRAWSREPQTRRGVQMSMLGYTSPRPRSRGSVCARAECAVASGTPAHSLHLRLCAVRRARLNCCILLPVIR